ncbi:MAG: DUF2267 domain-containing protein [Glycocaulis sp.]
MREPPVVLRDAVLETCSLLDEVRDGLGLRDRMQAYAAVRAVLHAMREGVPAISTLRIAAGMPLLAGGIAIEGWRPSPPGTQPPPFLDRAAEGLPLGFPAPADRAAACVLSALSARMEPDAVAGLSARVPGLLPPPSRPGAGR